MNNIFNKHVLHMNTEIHIYTNMYDRDELPEESELEERLGRRSVQGLVMAYVRERERERVILVEHCCREVW